MNDIPLDFKIENDRLIHELQPIAERMAEILLELPGDSDRIVIEYGGFEVIIKLINENESADKTPPGPED